MHAAGLTLGDELAGLAAGIGDLVYQVVTGCCPCMAPGTGPASTQELASVIGTSASSASEHAKALRTAGLVQTTRHGRGVRHSLTPLGRSLLDGQ
jgi:DNA-binding transcriptional ArsR family regulator